MKYGQLFPENLNDVTMTSSLFRILSNSNTNLPRAYLSDILNFILIGHKRAEIQGREVNRDAIDTSYTYRERNSESLRLFAVEVPVKQM